MKKKFKILFLAAVTFFMGSCGNDWLNLGPSTSLSSLDAVEDYADVYNLLVGTYNGLRGGGAGFYGAQIWYYGDVRADDVQARTTGMRASPAYEMQYTVLNAPSIWADPYSVNSRANQVIFSIEDGFANDGNPANVNDMLGQALTVRAICHFELVRVHGKPYTMSGAPASFGVPIMTERHEPDYLPSRNSVEEVYAAIIADLTRAIPLLKTAKSNGYINQWAAKALLARVYLTKGDYNNAYTTAVDIITNGGYPLWEYNEYEAAWSTRYGKENIFEFIIINTQGWTDREGIAYLYHESGYADMILTKNFLDLIDLPEHEGDVRKSLFRKPTLLNFVTEPFWDKPVFLCKLQGQDSDFRLNNVPVYRVAEQYLIAAEAALKKSSPDQAKADEYLNALVSKRNPSRGWVTATPESVITERRIELIGEGHRFFDVMRLGITVYRDDNGWHVPLINDSRAISRDYYRTILPIPQSELDANVNLHGQQNPGY